ncbi:MAG: hypothetical protein ACREJM_15690, partial [Candidatus Saccharimonadales bacterium]
MPIMTLLRASDAPSTPAGFNPIESLASFLPVAFALFCMITMRARNGYRGLHELASGTRVTRLQRVTASRRQRLPAVAPRVADRPASFGPFRQTGELGRAGSLNVRQARDELLDRPVWIYDGPREPAHFSAARRAVARPARVYWLQGGESGNRCWDAFEAVFGAALTDVVRCGGGQWHQSRLWLLDLAEELTAAIADGTLPPSLSLEQVWITRGGRVKLLDAAIRPISVSESATASPFAPTPEGQTVADGARDLAGSPFAAVSPQARAVGLLRAVLALCTREPLLPSHVRAFADELAERPDTRDTLEWAVARLREVVRRPTALAWDDRLGVLAVTMGTELSIYMGAAFGGVWLIASRLHWPIGASVAAALFAWLLPGIVGFVFRGGPAFWLTRIEVFRADGRRAGRWRCAWRNLVAWTALT